ncbi:MAG TPA: PLP-dependent transferase [Thermoanaerobaculia bacterium]|nr:PLP-dependent transferase [Thermoanaerobaculia bacterium]
MRPAPAGESCEFGVGADQRHQRPNTLALRLERAQRTAITLSEGLEKLPLVTRVRYPRSPSHPTHATARRVLKGFGPSSRSISWKGRVCGSRLPKRQAHSPCHQSHRGPSAFEPHRKIGFHWARSESRSVVSSSKTWLS